MFSGLSSLLDFTLVAPLAFMFLAWSFWLLAWRFCFVPLADALGLLFAGPVHLSVSVLLSCSWALSSFFGLQGLLSACSGLLGLLCVCLAFFGIARFCVSHGLTLAVAVFVSANEFVSSEVKVENALRVPRR